MTTTARNALTAPTTSFTRLSSAMAIAVPKPIAPVTISLKLESTAGATVIGGGTPTPRAGTPTATGETKTTSTIVITTEITTEIMTGTSTLNSGSPIALDA